MNRFVKELSMSLVMISSAIGAEKWQLPNDLNNSNPLQVGKANLYVKCVLVYARFMHGLLYASLARIQIHKFSISTAHAYNEKTKWPHKQRQDKISIG